MADVRVRDADDFVLEAALDGTLTAGAGETIFTEAATFIPSWNDVTWRRDGVLTYVLVDNETGPLNDADTAVNSGTAVKVTDNDTTPGGLLDKITSSDSSITITEVNDAGDEDLNFAVNEANVDHDALQNFVANEHVDHSTVSVVAGGDDGLLFATNNLTANIGLAVDIVGTTALGAAPDGADLILIDDATTPGTLRTVTVTQLLSTVSATDFCAFTGGIRDVDPGENVNATWGNDRSGAGPTMAFAGDIVGLSATSDQVITAGTIDIRVSINGVAQNAAGQTVTLNSSNQNASIDLTGAPIATLADDVLDIGAIASGTLAPNSHDITVTVWINK